MSASHKETIHEVLGRNTVHPFPARMAPGIAFDVLESNPRRQLRVLDPMMGSGTVLAVARAKGHRAIGVDVDPLAVLISRVWTTAIDRAAVKSKAKTVLNRARRHFSSLRVGDAYPPQSDMETRKFIRYWFDEYSRRQLASLAKAISNSHDKVTRDVLWCAFSRLIITKQAGASLAMDLAHSRPHKSFKRAPIKPFANFLAAVDRVLENCISIDEKQRGPAPLICKGDARKLRIADSSIDLVLTSPPYLNAIDYMRCSKFSLVWMGYNCAELRLLRSRSVGTEVGKRSAPGDEYASLLIKKLRLRPRLSARHKAVLARFIDDMHKAIHEITRVLVPSGKAIYVVGENTIRGTYIPNSTIVSAIAEDAGLVLEHESKRTLPHNRRYLPPPRNRARGVALDTRMRCEVILAFFKPVRRQTIRRSGR